MRLILLSCKLILWQEKREPAITRSSSPFSYVALSHDTAMAVGELPELSPAASCLCFTTIIPGGELHETRLPSSLYYLYTTYDQKNLF